MHASFSLSQKLAVCDWCHTAVCISDGDKWIDVACQDWCDIALITQQQSSLHTCNIDLVFCFKMLQRPEHCAIIVLSNTAHMQCASQELTESFAWLSWWISWGSWQTKGLSDRAFWAHAASGHTWHTFPCVGQGHFHHSHHHHPAPCPSCKSATYYAIWQQTGSESIHCKLLRCIERQIAMWRNMKCSPSATACHETITHCNSHGHDNKVCAATAWCVASVMVICFK